MITQKRILILLFFFIYCSCSNFGVANDSNEKSKVDVQEGWAGPPENPDQKPFDFYYIRNVGRASGKAIAKKSVPMMQKTCTDMAITIVKGNLIGKLARESLQGSGCSDGEVTGQIIVKEYSLRLPSVNAKWCQPLGLLVLSKTMEWEECECLFYIEVKGGRDAIVKRALEIEKR